MSDLTKWSSFPPMWFFDLWAPSYDRCFLQKVMYEPVHDAVLNAFSAAGWPPRDVVDVGCGTGRLLEAAGQRWSRARLTGIDVSETMIAEARRKYKGDARFCFKQGHACALPLRSASFDAAFSTYSFHYWGDQASGIREVARVLRPRADVPRLPLVAARCRRESAATSFQSHKFAPVRACPQSAAAPINNQSISDVVLHTLHAGFLCVAAINNDLQIQRSLLACNAPTVVSLLPIQFKDICVLSRPVIAEYRS